MKQTNYEQDMAAINEIANAEPYDLMHERKPYDIRLSELTHWYEKYGEVHKYYNLYGSDLVGADVDSYLDYENTFVSIRDQKNLKGLPYSQIGLLQDKYVFYKYLMANGIPTVPVFAFYDGGALYDENMSPLRFEQITENGFFVKSIIGLAGNDVHYFENIDDFMKVEPDYSRKKYKYIFQKGVHQAEYMKKLYEGGVSSLRIVTTNIRGDIRVFAKALRIPTAISGKVDNFSVGGVAVGVNDDGRLKEVAKIMVINGTGSHTIIEHPDSHIRFTDFVLKDLDKAIALVEKAHRFFYQLGSIGWDVVFTTEGPMLLEGNDNWGLGLVQAVDRPLRKEWLDLMG